MLLLQSFITDFRNFRKLAILICHLFIGGQFRMVNILYHSDGLDHRIFNAIDSYCPNEISQMQINLNLTEIFEWNYKQHNDHILQIIFVKADRLNEVDTALERFFAYYRLFVFNIERPFDLNISTKSILDSNSVALFHPTEENIEAYSIYTKQSIQLETFDQVFENIFGVREKQRTLTVHVPINPCKLANSKINFQVKSKEKNYYVFVGNYMFNRLNMTFIDMRMTNCDEKRYSENSKFKKSLYRHIPSPIYDELSWNIQPFGNGTE